MRYDPERHHRHSIRLQAYNYAQSGAYFVTICVQGRECCLGAVAVGAVQQSPYGRMVGEWWDRLPRRFPTLDLDARVVMPNHLHGIIVLHEPAVDATILPVMGKGGEIPPLPRTASPVGAGFPRPDPCEGANPSSMPDSLPGAGNVLGRPTLGQIVAYFKYESTKAVNQARSTPGLRLWQRNYYEHVIRDEKSLERLRAYIVENPLRWVQDQLHPDNPSKW